MNQGLMSRIAAEKFVSLTTFRRDGTPVSTPMWIARDGHLLVVWTPADTWKVKRLRRDTRIELRPCGRTGKVQPGSPVLRGTAEVISGAPGVSRAAAQIKHKYGLQFRLITFFEAVLVTRGRKPRVALHITPGS